jgi:hypothetical protein
MPIRYACSSKLAAFCGPIIRIKILAPVAIASLIMGVKSVIYDAKIICASYINATHARQLGEGEDWEKANQRLRCTHTLFISQYVPSPDSMAVLTPKLSLVANITTRLTL